MKESINNDQLAIEYEAYYRQVSDISDIGQIPLYFPRARKLIDMYTFTNNIPVVQKPKGTIHRTVSPDYFSALDLEKESKIKLLEETLSRKADKYLKSWYILFTQTQIESSDIKAGYSEARHLFYYLSSSNVINVDRIYQKIMPGYKLNEVIKEWFISHVGSGNQLKRTTNDEFNVLRVGLTSYTRVHEYTQSVTAQSCPAHTKHISAFFNTIAHIGAVYGPLIAKHESLA